MNIEICLDNLESVDVVAKFPEITRLEICSALSLDGLTPAPYLVQYAKEKSMAYRHTMIRPRAGDLCYNEAEIKMMAQEIKLMHESGANGVVIGVLDVNSHINIAATRYLTDLAKSYQLEVTFHRAIDMVPDYLASVQICVDLGINRILTSGGQKKAFMGLDDIAKVVQKYHGQIEIMAGGGVNKDNIPHFKKVGVDAVHFSAASNKSNVKGESVFSKSSLSYNVTNEDIVKENIAAISPSHPITQKYQKLLQP
ncbi:MULTISPECIES: copper homeostasis protein CutC [Cysteiniphilum]|uniref:copper homeostasis protein CutC n=1 Tax=Cysteiniphilum TaxID=2056696 RepID=UPI0017857ACD|nr:MULTISPECIES: copper homeostasis protein CutC [Cysteiniphilum]